MFLSFLHRRNRLWVVCPTGRSADRSGVVSGWGTAPTLAWDRHAQGGMTTHAHSLHVNSARCGVPVVQVHSSPAGPNEKVVEEIHVQVWTAPTWQATHSWHTHTTRSTSNRRGPQGVASHHKHTHTHTHRGAPATGAGAQGRTRVATQHKRRGFRSCTHQGGRDAVGPGGRGQSLQGGARGQQGTGACRRRTST